MFSLFQLFSRTLVLMVIIHETLFLSTGSDWTFAIKNQVTTYIQDY